LFERQINKNYYQFSLLSGFINHFIFDKMFSRYTGLHLLIQNLSVTLSSKIGAHKKVASSAHNSNNHKSAFPGNNLIFQHEEKLYVSFSLHHIKYLEDEYI